MEQNEISVLFKKYGLTAKDWYKHKHYQIITRQGIDKIQAKEKIFIEYSVEMCSPEYCAVKATAKKDNATIQTFGSAKYGGKVNKDGKWIEIGNTTTWYVMEMAEKRAMSRAVLKLTGFYELGVFGEDESEDFKKQPATKIKPDAVRESIKNAIGQCTTLADLQHMWSANKELQSEQFFIDLKNNRKKILEQNGISD
jgi:hypothetical protein